MLALQPARALERWDEDFECQISRSSPKHPSTPTPAGRSSSPLSSLSWAESDKEDSHVTLKLNNLFSSESAEGTEAENGPRALRKRQERTCEGFERSSQNSILEVEMTASTAELKHAVPSGPSPQAPVRPPIPHLSSFGSDDAHFSGHHHPSSQLRYLSTSAGVAPSYSQSIDTLSSVSTTEHPSSTRQSLLGLDLPYGHDASISPTDYLRDGKPRTRLRKRSRVGKATLSSSIDVDSDEDLAQDVPSNGAAQDKLGPAASSSSPRQIITRGMTSIQRKFSLSKGKNPATAYGPQPRQPASPPSPQAAFRRPARRPQIQPDGQSRSASSSADIRAGNGSRPVARTPDRSNFLRGSPPRKGHRTSCSVNSIPLQTPPTYNKPLPSVVGPPFDSGVPLPSQAGIPTCELQRSVSTPSVNPNIARRNSLSDLRIPSRVASAQKALREKVSVVKEFATKVADLKTLQRKHSELQSDLLQRFAHLELPTRSSNQSAASLDGMPPSILHHHSDERALVTAALSNNVRQVEAQYEQWWEMAEVLTKLAGTGVDDSTLESNRTSSSSMTSERARAITLHSHSSRVELPATPPSVPHCPPKASPERWRGSTGRTDLSQRQLDVLRSMLTTPVSKSAFVLPSEDEFPHHRNGTLDGNAPPASDPPTTTFIEPLQNHAKSHPARPQGLPTQQRRASRAGGVNGLKSFLRSLKIGSDYTPPEVLLPDGKSSSTPDTLELGVRSSGGTMETLDPSIGLAATRKSPRRPSLASIFRFGKDGSNEWRSKKKNRPLQASGSKTEVRPAAGEDSDWERMSVDSNPMRPQTPATPGHASGRTTPYSAYSGIVGRNRCRSSSPPPVPPLPTPFLPARSAPPNPPADWPSSQRRTGAGQPSSEDYSTIQVTPENLPPLLMYVREVERHCTQCLDELSASMSLPKFVPPVVGNGDR